MFWKSVKIFLLYCVMFFIFSQPVLYTLTNQLGLNTLSEGNPNLKGIAVHSVLFAIVLSVIIITFFNTKKYSEFEKYSGYLEYSERNKQLEKEKYKNKNNKK